MKLKSILKYTFFMIVSYFLFTFTGNHNFYYSPDKPPVLYSWFNHPMTGEVERYQSQLISYIQYLQEYYVNVGVHLHGDKDIPVKYLINKECQLYDYIFKTIELPLLPIADAEQHQLDKIINRLVEYIIDTNNRIVEHNRYQEQLRENYRNCFKQD